MTSVQQTFPSLPASTAPRVAQARPSSIVRRAALALASLTLATGGAFGTGVAAAAPGAPGQTLPTLVQKPVPLGPANPLPTRRGATRARCARHARSRWARSHCQPRPRPGRPLTPSRRLRPVRTGAPAPALPAPVAAAQTCTGSDLIPTGGNVAEVRDATLCLVNRERANAGLPSLSVSGVLQAVAQRKSEDMVRNDYFEHTSPSGETAGGRVLNSGYVPAGAGYSIGENIAFGTLELSTPAKIVDGWMHSPGHRANILDPDFRETGMGVAPAAPASYSAGQPGGTYSQEFGRHD